MDLISVADDLSHQRLSSTYLQGVYRGENGGEFSGGIGEVSNVVQFAS